MIQLLAFWLFLLLLPLLLLLVLLARALVSQREKSQIVNRGTVAIPKLTLRNSSSFHFSPSCRCGLSERSLHFVKNKTPSFSHSRRFVRRIEALRKLIPFKVSQPESVPRIRKSTGNPCGHLERLRFGRIGSEHVFVPPCNGLAIGERRCANFHQLEMKSYRKKSPAVCRFAFSVCLKVSGLSCRSIGVSICESVCSSVCLSVRPSDRPTNRTFVCKSSCSFLK